MTDRAFLAGFLMLSSACGTQEGPAGLFGDPPPYGVQEFCDMTELSRLALPGQFKSSLDVIDHYAYVAWGGVGMQPGLEVVDISSPSAPKVVGHADTGDFFPFQVRAVADQNLILVAHQWDGVLVYDVSDRINPQLISTLLIDPEYDPTQPYGVRVTDVDYDGRYAYVSGTHLVIYDMQNPANPVRVGHVPAPWEDAPIAERFASLSESVAVRGDYAYVSDITGRLVIVDVTDKTAPFIVSTARWAGIPRRVLIKGDVAYMNDYILGVRTADLSNPTDPQVMDTIPTSGESFGSYLRDDRLYIGDNLNGILSFDVSDPSAVNWKGYFPVPGEGQGVGIFQGGGPWGIWAGDGLVIAANTEDLLIVRDCDD